MLRTGLVIDPRYQEHHAGAGHPERAARIEILLAVLDEFRRPEIERLDPRPATVEEIALVHDRAHIARVDATAKRSFFAFDPDTWVSSRSAATARLATGGLLTLVDAIMAGEVNNGFALVRPPGHHAEFDRALGFCLFNNVAIAARYLREKHRLARVLIFDWDVHHGNGTQHSFAADPTVLYVSFHQYPFYPGTGAVGEVGDGPGEGYTVNLPLPAGSGDQEYRHLFAQVVDPICRQFDPEFVLISAGFDAHLRDPIGSMRLTADSFGWFTRMLLRLAADCAQGRCAAVLEGGYDLEALGRSVLRVLDDMAGTQLAEPLPALGAPPDLLPRVQAVQRRYWELP